MGSAPQPFLCSASGAFSCSHFSKTLKSRGLGSFPALLPRVASPCGQ